MEVILADVLGYCMGVRRAMEKVISALNNRTCNNLLKSNVYSLGPLIHNQFVLDMLTKEGLCVLKEDEIEKISENSTVVIRAHGIPPYTLKKLKIRNCIIVDATCPRVLANQKTVSKYASLGYTIVFAGDKNHGEVTAIAGYAGDNFILLENINDALKLKDSIQTNKNAILLSQTTFSPSVFNDIAKVLSSCFSNLKIINTICPATKERQCALLNLCPKVDGILVVGGKDSANTQRLFQIAKENCKNTAFIETADEIPESFFYLEKVGITAGASTPDDIIFSVQKKLKSF